MPLQLTVSRNRKTSENYNSEGHGISLSVELDQSLLTKPRELQEKIDYLYREAETALDQAAGTDNGSKSNGKSNGRSTNGRTSGGNGSAGTMTAAQRKAIDAIGRRLGLDVEVECRDEFGSELDQLDVRGASKLIDHLKALQGAGGRR